MKPSYYQPLVLLATILTWMLASSQSIAGRPLRVAQAAGEVVTLGEPMPIDINIDEVVASGLDHPVQVTHANDGSGRLFVVEQPGVIRIIQNGILLPDPFLDIKGRVLYGGERGLLGLAFPPNYASVGHFYVNYTRRPDGSTVVARFKAVGNQAAADSEQPILTVAQPYANHNGGQLAFGPLDGYLYIGMGDGGSAGDPRNHAQDPATLLGKMLRIDVESGASPYGIPPDNPFVGAGDPLDEIWALGLRNPWRFSFDRATGDLYIADVGQNAWEEISFQAAGTPGGLNFGWRCKEGNHDYNFSAECATRQLTDPIAEYGHDLGQSVTGGFVYRGSQFPALVGRYFYADYVQGQIWSIALLGSDPARWSAPVLELDTDLNISSLGEDEQGELYVVDYGGTVRRLTGMASSSLACPPQCSAYLPVVLRFLA